MSSSERFDEDGCRWLIEAVILLAVSDYRQALRRISRNSRDVYAAGTIRALERFFRGDYFALMTGLDPEALIERLRREVKGHGRI